MAGEVITFDDRAVGLKNLVLKDNGKLVADDRIKLRKGLCLDLKDGINQLNGLRAGSGTDRPIDLSMGEYVREKWGFSCEANGTPESFYRALGLNPSSTTLSQLMAMPEFDEGFRWLVTEVIREAVRLGMRRAPIYPNLIVAEESVAQPTVIMPHVNLSDAMPTKLGEAETIPVGSMSFGQKSVKLQKVGVGITVTDEVLQYVSLNVVSTFLQDMGVKMNLALDSLAISTLINGDQAGGGDAAAVVGVLSTVNGLTYEDLLKAWIRLSTLGRTPGTILTNEAMALELLMMDEFRNRNFLPDPQRINLRTPIPQTSNVDVHGAMPSADQIMLVDPSSALLKLNASALRVESDRIVNRQINGTYATLTTGFATMFRDARLIIDESVLLSAAPYPAWLNPFAAQQAEFNS